LDEETRSSCLAHNMKKIWNSPLWYTRMYSKCPQWSSTEFQSIFQIRERSWLDAHHHQSSCHVATDKDGTGFPRMTTVALDLREKRRPRVGPVMIVERRLPSQTRSRSSAWAKLQQDIGDLQILVVKPFSTLASFRRGSLDRGYLDLSSSLMTRMSSCLGQVTKCWPARTVLQRATQISLDQRVGRSPCHQPRYV
jgi:hypothetical protein